MSKRQLTGEEIEIREINYGIGYYCTNEGEHWIELNKHLKKYPKLHQSVLNHELEHARLNNKNIDFWHDFKSMFGPMNFELTKFSLKHPSALLSNSPILFTKKGIAFNWFMCLVWGAVLSGLGIWRLM